MVSYSQEKEMIMNTLLIDLERVALEDDKEKVMRLLKSIAECTGMKMEYLIKRMKEAQMSTTWN